MAKVDVQDANEEIIKPQTTDEKIGEQSNEPITPVVTEEAPTAEPALTPVETEDAFETEEPEGVTEVPQETPEPAVEETVEPAQESEPEIAADVAPAPVVAGQRPSLRPHRRTAHLLTEGLLVAAVIGLGLWAWTLQSDKQNLNAQLSALQANPQAAVEKQSNELISRVGRLYDLPTDEKPTVAAVSDAAAAKQQSAFFANAQNGDKVLMYVKAGIAILYRPSTDKVILVAPLTFNNAAK